MKNNLKKSSTISRLLSYLYGYKVELIFLIITTILTAIGTALIPYMIGIIMDDYIGVYDLDGTFKILMVFGIIVVIIPIFNALQTVIAVNISQKTVQKIRSELFEKFQTLSIRFFDTNSNGDLMSRVVNDVDNINNALSQAVIQILTAIFTVAGVLIAMFRLNLPLALTNVIIVPLMYMITRYIGKKVKISFRRRQKALGNLNGYIEETISGEDVITLYGKQGDVLKEFDKKSEELKISSIAAETYSGYMGPIMNFTNNLVFIMVVVVGGYLALTGRGTVGLIAAFIIYARQFQRPINQVTNLYNVIQGAVAGAARVFEIMDTETEIKNSENALEKVKLKGEVEFNKVTFGYDKEKTILKNISLKAKQGEKIALVGPTGSGKTTIINLLGRFYDINSGEIKIDGKDIKDYDVNTLRSNIGIVLQDSILFSGTIMENIRYGRLNATDEEVIKAAKLSSAHKFIKYLPNKYGTYISGEGDNLSQGEKQLIAIARAILANHNILVLDEATSNIDTKTEQQIQKGFNVLMEGRTTFIIAHRLKTIENADKIIVIKDGEIIEEGSHRKLLSDDGFYADLYKSQFDI